MQQIIVIIIIFTAILIGLRRPCFAFSTFLLAGAFKADPRVVFISIYVDFTILFSAITIIGIFRQYEEDAINRLAFSWSFIIYSTISLMMLISLSYTSSPHYGLDKTFRFIAFIGLATISPFFLFKKRSDLWWFIAPFIVMMLLLNIDLITSGEENDRRVRALSANYLAFGRINGVALFFSLYLITQWKKPFVRLLLLASMALSLYGVVSAGGRGPLLATIATLALAFLLHQVGKINHSLRGDTTGLGLLDMLRSVGAIAMTGGAFVMAFLLAQRYFAQELARYQLALSGGGESIFTRISFARTALNTINSSEGLWGVGVGGFNALVERPDTAQGTYPHNMLLEIWVELGALVLIVFLIGINMTMLRCVFKSYTIFSAEIRLLVLLFVFAIVNALFSGNLNDNRFVFTFLAALEAFILLAHQYDT
ncbi:MAG: hypothetical protein Q8O14_12300 [bacterium]|jgi:O-antigen ligase|nr:hypothetical protein [bacterium]